MYKFLTLAIVLFTASNLSAQIPIEEGGYISPDPDSCYYNTVLTFRDGASTPPLFPFRYRTWNVTNGYFSDYSTSTTSITINSWEDNTIKVVFTGQDSADLLVSDYSWYFLDPIYASSEIKVGPKSNLEDIDGFNPTTMVVDYAASPNIETVRVIDDDSNGPTYTWSVPTGYAIFSGQGSTTLKFIPNSLDDGDITVVKSISTESLSNTISVSRSLENPDIDGLQHICDLSPHSFDIDCYGATSYLVQVNSGDLLVEDESTGTYSTFVNNTSGTFNLKVTDQSEVGNGQIRVKGYRWHSDTYSDWSYFQLYYGGLPSFTIDGPTAVMCQDYPTYFLSPNMGVFPIDWMIDYGPAIIHDAQLNNCQLEITGSGTIQLRATVVGDCNSPSDTFIINSSCENPLVYPNPASFEITVDMTKFDEESVDLENDYELLIVGQLGESYIKDKHNKKKKKYKVNKIPDGQVNVIVTYKGKVYSLPLLIMK